jgi:hypothetical protein
MIQFTIMDKTFVSEPVAISAFGQITRPGPERIAPRRLVTESSKTPSR